MNTQLAFAFGMLAMVAIIMMVAIVVGMVKAVKQQNKITSLEKWIDDTNRFAENNIQELERRITDDNRQIYDEIATKDRQVREEIGLLHRHQSDVERGIYAEINETRNRFDRYTDEFRKESTAYTDSRVDKLEQKLAGTLGSKQILKD